jgi:predicted alpha/beta hydrolase
MSRREITPLDEARKSEVAFSAADGFSLSATLYKPARQSGFALQINSAAGTPRAYYRTFAGFMAARGHAVFTYDVRGVEREGADVRHSPASVLASGTLDQAAATRWLADRYPDLPLAILGHSVGGQILGLSPEFGRFRAAMLVGSGHGYWRRAPRFWLRLRRLLAVHLIGPPIVFLLGYMPAFVIGGAAKGPILARELMRFGRSPHFFCDEEGRALRPHNADFRGALRFLLIEDDEVVPPGNELNIEEYFPNARREKLLLRPANYGVTSIRHFGLFRRSMPERAWADIASWYERAIEA